MLKLRYNRKNLLEGCLKKDSRATFSIVVDTETDSLGRVIRWVNCLLIDPKANDVLLIQKMRKQFKFINKFYVIKGNKSFSNSKDGILFSKDGEKLISCPTSYIKTKCIIPYGVTKIEAQAFEEVPALSKIVVPSTVREFGLMCFAFNPNLEKIEFEPGIKHLDLTSLYGCTNLKYGYVDTRTNNIIISSAKPSQKKDVLELSFNPKSECDLFNISKQLLKKQSQLLHSSKDETITLRRTANDKILIDFNKMTGDGEINKNDFGDEDALGR